MPECKRLVLFFLILLGIISSSPLNAQNTIGKTRFSSILTDLSKECQNAFKEVGEGQDMPLKCKGYGQYYVYIYYSAMASHITVRTIKNDDASIYLSSEKINFDRQKSSKVEWRLADGKPFAVILRVSKYNEKVMEEGGNPYTDKYKIGESILVKGLKGYEHIDFEVNAKTTPDALTKARELADTAYLKSRP